MSALVSVRTLQEHNCSISSEFHNVFQSERCWNRLWISSSDVNVSETEPVEGVYVEIAYGFMNDLHFVVLDCNHCSTSALREELFDGPTISKNVEILVLHVVEQKIVTDETTQFWIIVCKCSQFGIIETE